jgi:hypothetical protein
MADSDRARLFEAVKHEFLTVTDTAELGALVERAPFMLEDDFLGAAEQWLAEADAAGALDVAEGIRERLEVLRELVAEAMPSWRAAIDRFAAARSTDDVEALARDIPLVRQRAFQGLIEGLIAEARQNGDEQDAEALQLRLDDLIRASQALSGTTLAGLIAQMRASDPVATAARAESPELLEQAERQALALLRNLSDQQQLLTLVQQAPFVLDDPFLTLVEQAIAAADLAEDRTVAGGLRARLEGLRMIRAQVQITLPQTLEAFASVRDGGDLLALGQRVPFIYEESFIAAVESAIDELEQGGGQIEAQGLRARLDALRQIRIQREMAEQSPLMQALILYLNAAEDAEARQIYAEQRELLDDDQAQATLDEEFSGGDPESQQRIEERSALLRELRQQR